MLDFFAPGSRFAVRDVLRHGGAKEKRFLKNDAYAAPKLIELQLANIHSINQHAPARHVIKPRNKVHERSLPGTRWPHDCNRLPRLSHKAHVRE